MRIYGDQVLDDLSCAATLSPRRRSNFNVHTSYSDRVQKLFIHIQANSYIRPHRHVASAKNEFFIVVSGSVRVVIFNNDGGVTEVVNLGEESQWFACEITPYEWHTVICTGKEAIIFEVKEGPFDAKKAKEFPYGAPEEGSQIATTYMEQIRAATD